MQVSSNEFAAVAPPPELPTLATLLPDIRDRTKLLGTHVSAGIDNVDVASINAGVADMQQITDDITKADAAIKPYEPA